jgi:preprotein translocase subunit SecA
MITALTRWIVGDSNARKVKRYERRIPAINALEPEIAKLTDSNLALKTKEFRDRLAKGETLDSLLPEAFAVVREASKRTLGQRHFDVQLIGGMALHEKTIAEMRTGEGKTLVATLAAYLNAIPGTGVHIITVNDYLAKRDAEWMGQIYRFLGLTVGTIVHGLTDEDRRAAYAADITYGTNNEFGFDYLRDNMRHDLPDMVQRPFNFAIVDEVDSILIDEARTPLIISGPSTDSSELYMKVDTLIPRLGPDDYEKDEKNKNVFLTEQGSERMEEWLREVGLLEGGNLYDMNNVGLVHHITAALKAHKQFQRDADYIVKEGRVIIIDEFTGRMMEGRRWSDGLHQAVEAKEKVAIQRENQTLASITFQNYFRLYPKLAGMTGTAMTEKDEFGEIYGLDVLSIPTNIPVSRIDHDDEFYLGQEDKYQAIIKQIRECNARGQPVLVGTVSIEKSELLSAALKAARIEHNVLNAKFHEQEAAIIAQAGRLGAVTIATNMAGRGTDIQLGGHVEMRIKNEDAVTEGAMAAIRAEVEAAREKVREAGGLFVIGTERHESRRIDNQLRGRSGRQGDPGASKFFLAMDDDLLRIFAGGKLQAMMSRAGMKPGEPVHHPFVSKAMQMAQGKLEERNFDIRKNIVKFDNVMNDQRKVIYEQRKDVMQAIDVSEAMTEFRHELVENLVNRCLPKGSYAEQWDIKLLGEETRRLFNLDLPFDVWAKEDGIAEREIEERLRKNIDDRYSTRTSAVPKDRMQAIEKGLLLQVLDHNWKEHLLRLDHLKQGIGLRAMGQRDPLNEYRREAFELYQAMENDIRSETIATLMRLEVQLVRPEDLMAKRPPQEMMEIKPEPEAVMAFASDEPLPEGMRRSGNVPQLTPLKKPSLDMSDPATWTDTPRNAPCPCGSGKKYKQCHGRI